MKQGLVKVVLLEEIGNKAAGSQCVFAATTAAKLIKMGKAERVSDKETPKKAEKAPSKPKSTIKKKAKT